MTERRCIEDALREALSEISGRPAFDFADDAALQGLGLDEEEIWDAVDDVARAQGLDLPAAETGEAARKAERLEMSLRHLAALLPGARAALRALPPRPDWTSCTDTVASLAETLRSGRYRPATAPRPMPPAVPVPLPTVLLRWLGPGAALAAAPALRLIRCSPACRPCPTGLTDPALWQSSPLLLLGPSILIGFALFLPGLGLLWKHHRGAAAEPMG
ncbi:hypothetical protein LHP98_09415 [Rhodobacter sp. Har01]|uniref:hypothetical protein n=1 Tax=Rhodobacter sp. Har01 TaxID=2883999 RepID=UPI001D096BFE|nr:hypothetical protein [Rhodobacter sp. Har01]MCB6178347.1 hypothetical protein [Rhodobacter sp. Har01]